MIDNEKLYREVLTEFGAENQVNMCIEECAELIVALEHYKRQRLYDKDVITEIADVQIVCEQMRILLGEEAVDNERAYKLKRLAKRLEEHKNKKEHERLLLNSKANNNDC